MERIANMNSRGHVESQSEFQGNNLCGKQLSDRVYVVRSYGWYSLWACIDDKWYGHNSRYSQSTSKQTTQSMPFMYGGGDITILNTVNDLEKLISKNM